MDMVYRIDKVNEYLKIHNLTKKQFCKECKISPNTLSKVFHHSINVGLNDIARIAFKLNLQIYQFLY